MDATETVLVKVYGVLRGIMGSYEIKLHIKPKETVGELLEELVRRYGSKLEKVLMEPSSGKPRPYYIILVNNEATKSLDKPLKNGDAVAILPPMEGG